MVQFEDFLFNVRYLVSAEFERNGNKGIIKIGVFAGGHYEEYVREYSNWAEGDTDFFILTRHIESAHKNSKINGLG